jgi:Tol biopolymer transport system component
MKPTGGNPDGNFEIFLYDQAHNTTRQLTATENCRNGSAPLAGGDSPMLPIIIAPMLGTNGGPSVSRDGAVVAFTSSCQIASEDGDAFPDVYVHYVASGSTVLLPDCPNCRMSFNPELSGSGRIVTYYSALWDETQQRPAEAFLRWVDLSLPDRPATGLCPGTLAGTVAAFPADTDRGNALILHVANFNATGENEDGQAQVFLTDARTGETRQVSSSTLPGPPRGNVRLSDNGAFGAFAASGRLYRFEINR